jgi:hypothetical protein
VVAIAAVGVGLVLLFAKKPFPTTPGPTPSGTTSAQVSELVPQVGSSVAATSAKQVGSSVEGSPGSLTEGATARGSRTAEMPASDSIYSVSLTMSKPIVPADDKHDANPDLRGQLVGTWEQYDHGNRLLTIRADGTATLEVRPEAVWRLLFGRRLLIEIEWTIEQQTLAFHTVGGKPAARVKLVNEMYGNQRVYQIENVPTDELMLRDEQGEHCHPWQRIDPAAERSVSQNSSAANDQDSPSGPVEARLPRQPKL